MTTMPPPAKPPVEPTGLVPAQSEKWHQRLGRSGYLVGAILFHVILFLLVATWIVFRAPDSPSDSASFQPVKIQPPPPPTPPAPAGGESASKAEPSVDTTPPPTAPTVVTVNTASSFNVKSVTVQLPNLPASLTAPSGSDLSGHKAPGSGDGPGTSPFGGSPVAGPSQLTGYLYDLKQSADRKPTGMNPDRYHEVLRQFVADDWNPKILNDYYKSPKPLSTPYVFIPRILAADGPAAFKVEKEVQPNMYCVWYKVTAAPLQDGTYRFIGNGDDILAVRVGHRTVLDGCSFAITSTPRDQQTIVYMTHFSPTFEKNAEFWVGTKFQAKAHEALDIDILIGEQPGGNSDYFVYIQREESTYEKQSNGTPLYPIFQVSSDPVHIHAETDFFPPYSATPEPWESVAK